MPGKIYRGIEKMRVNPAPNWTVVVALQDVDLDAILHSTEI